jgi:hypothetical protein
MLSVELLKSIGIDPNLPLSEMKRQISVRLEKARAHLASLNLLPEEENQQQEPRQELQAPRWARDALRRLGIERYQ